MAFEWMAYGKSFSDGFLKVEGNRFKNIHNLTIKNESGMIFRAEIVPTNVVVTNPKEISFSANSAGRKKYRIDIEDSNRTYTLSVFFAEDSYCVIYTL